MSIVRPNASQMARRLMVLAATVFAIVIGQAQVLLGWGQSPAEFSADSDATLRVAGYAFAIWGVIYLWLLVYAVRQALPQTGESRLINRLGWPSLAALLGILALGPERGGYAPAGPVLAGLAGWLIVRQGP